MFRQYTQCYQHVLGDKPFNKSDLAAFVSGSSAPGLIGALIAFLSGVNWLGYVIIAIQYASTIVAVANEWLFHRLVCISGDQCAVGTVQDDPTRSDLGEFDNDQFFDLRPMPHRLNDEYCVDHGACNDNNNFDASVPGVGKSQDGKTELHPANDIYLDGFQGQQLIRPLRKDPMFPNFADLPYDVKRSVLHCEAEGNFWQAMKDSAFWQGTAVGTGAVVGAGAGAAVGCAIGAFFFFIGCLIGAIIGAIAGGFAGAAAGAYIGANAAFNSEPGDVEDANVGDLTPSPIQKGDRVVVYGTHVYDGFHDGWHEIHPLKAVMKFDLTETANYLEWDPAFSPGWELPQDTPDMPPTITGLILEDMATGLESPKFRARAEWLRDRWCELIREAFSPPLLHTQQEPENRWTVHPSVDGCQRNGARPPIR
jgi:hypothetical protein